MRRIVQYGWGSVVIALAILFLHGSNLSSSAQSNTSIRGTIQIAHLAQEPTEPVTIQYNNLPNVQTVEYGDVSGYRDISKDSAEMTLSVLDNEGTLAAFYEETLPVEGKNYGYIFTGNGTSRPWSTTQVELLWPAPTNQAYLRFGHMASTFDMVDWQTEVVDFRLADGSILADDIAYGEITTQPFVVTPGEIDLKITTSDGATVLVDPFPFTIKDQGSSTFILTAETDEAPIQLYEMYGSRIRFRGRFTPIQTLQGSLHLSHMSPQVGPVEFIIDDVPTGVVLNFGEANDTVKLDPGNYKVTFRDLTTGDIYGQRAVAIKAEQLYTGVLNGGSNEHAVELTWVNDKRPTIINVAKMRVGHFAPFAKQIPDTRLDVCLSDGTLLENGITYDQIDSKFDIQVPVGTLNFIFSTDNCTTAIAEFEPITIEGGDWASLYITGDGVSEPLGAYWIVRNMGGQFIKRIDINTGTETEFYIAQLAPIPGRPTTMIDIDGRSPITLTNVAYGGSTPYQTVSTGIYSGTLTNEANDQVLAQTFGVQAASDQPQTWVAFGDGEIEPVQWTVLNDDPTEAGGDKVKIRFGHFLSVAGNPVDTAVSICLQDGTTLIEAIRFGEVDESYSVVLPAGRIDFKISNLGCQGNILDPEPITFQAGDVVSLFATGTTGDASEAMYLILNDEPGRFVDPAGETRLVWSNLAPLANGATVHFNSPGRIGFSLPFGGTNGYFNTAAGAFTLIATPNDPNIAPIEQTTTLEPGTDTSSLVIGDGVRQPFSLITQNDTPPATSNGMAKIRFGNLAPFEADLNATRIDILDQNGGMILNDIPFGSIQSDYLEFPAGEINLQFTNADGSNLLFDPAALTMQANSHATIYFVGNRFTAPLQAYMINANGTGVFLEPEIPAAAFQFANLIGSDNAPTLDGLINGTMQVQDVEPGEISPFTSVESGIGVYSAHPEGRSEVNGTAFFLANRRYIQAIYGDESAEAPLRSKLLLVDLPPTTGSLLTVVHTDSKHTQNISVQHSGGDKLMETLPFGAHQSVSIDSGSVDIEILDNTSDEVLYQIDGLTVSENQTIVIFLFTDSETDEPAPIPIYQTPIPTAPDPIVYRAFLTIVSNR